MEKLTKILSLCFDNFFQENKIRTALSLANNECRLLSEIHPRVGEEALKHLRHDSSETRQPEVHSVRLFIAAGSA
jgi:hypothetical protein